MTTQSHNQNQREYQKKKQKERRAISKHRLFILISHWTVCTLKDRQNTCYDDDWTCKASIDWSIDRFLWAYKINQSSSICKVFNFNDLCVGVCTRVFLLFFFCWFVCVKKQFKWNELKTITQIFDCMNPKIQFRPEVRWTRVVQKKGNRTENYTHSFTIERFQFMNNKHELRIHISISTNIFLVHYFVFYRTQTIWIISDKSLVSHLHDCVYGVWNRRQESPTNGTANILTNKWFWEIIAQSSSHT